MAPEMTKKIKELVVERLGFKIGKKIFFENYRYLNTVKLLNKVGLKNYFRKKAAINRIRP